MRGVAARKCRHISAGRQITCIFAQTETEDGGGGGRAGGGYGLCGVAAAAGCCAVFVIVPPIFDLDLALVGKACHLSVAHSEPVPPSRVSGRHLLQEFIRYPKHNHFAIYYNIKTRIFFLNCSCLLLSH